MIQWLLVFSIYIGTVSTQASVISWGPPDVPKAALYIDPKQATDYKGGIFRFWVCSDSHSKLRQVRCDDLGVDELEGPRAELVVLLEQKKFVHQYGLRHAASLMECARMRGQIKRLAAQSARYCIRGEAAGDEQTPSGKILQGWVFDEFRTPFGHVCWSDDCVK